MIAAYVTCLGPPIGASAVVTEAESTLRSYATEAGFGEVEILPIENDFFRFYRLRG